MNRPLGLFSLSIVAASLSAIAIAAETQPRSEAKVGDACARSDDGVVWTVGTKSVEMTFDGRGGAFRLSSFLNKTCEPALEYVDAKSAAAPFNLDASAKNDSQWTLKAAASRQVSSGGRPAVQLDVTLARGGVLAQFHVMAFPGTSILRQWVEIENKSAAPIELKSPTSARFQLRGDEATSYLNSWMVGGHVAADQGKMYQQPVTAAYAHKLVGTASVSLVPWTALHRATGPKDGLFLALDYLGTWSLGVDHESTGPLTATAGIPELKSKVLAPGQRFEMPWVVLGVFHDGLDNMAASLYDWQYEYLWDYTNPDYYARTRNSVHWFFCSYNLQEQFTARLAALDMDTSDAMRAMGYEMLWDDAGWSSCPGFPPDGYGSVFNQTYEGPDFAETQRYLRKMGMHWILWFVGRPPAGVLDAKIAAWGDFEWRTDGVTFPDITADKSFRADVKRFLDAHPDCTFHTCSGGSTYAHTFEIGGRYASYNYLSDLGRGPYVNHFFSYLEPPDRWGDSITGIMSIYGRKDGSSCQMAEVLAKRNGVPPAIDDLRYDKDTARGMLTTVPNTYWGATLRNDDREFARYDVDLYRFLRSQGLAGRWCYVFHPAVEGDPEYYYFQRTSRDRRKACIIITHRAEQPSVIRPRGLTPDGQYMVGFDSTRATQQRTGADLMTNGIAIKDRKAGELIYLNVPNRPGSGTDGTSPQAPGRVLATPEMNIGHSGMGVYWSPGADDRWVSYYEVRRDERILDKVAIGSYYFDHADGWADLHRYTVRTVDGDGNRSDWTAAESLAGAPMTFSALGGHFPQRGRDGWSTETTDGRVFAPMTWIPPAKSPAADFGGTPHQRGGVEGYWEGAGGARVGRGWQRASTSEGCVRTWTAPRTGTIHVVGRAIKEYYHRDQGKPLNVKILHGRRQVWPERDWAAAPSGDLTGVAHDLTLEIAKGDVIRFVLDKGTNPENDLLAWMPRIVYDEPQPAAAPLPLTRILCGSQTPYTDRCGNVWTADRHYVGGAPISTGETIEAVYPTLDDQTLYQHGRAGREFTYAIPAPAGLYAVRLKFAEPKHTWMFERPFCVDINGQRMLADFDVLQTAKKPRRALDRTFRNVVPNADGKIVLRFTADSSAQRPSDDAMVQAIEILPEPRNAIRVNAGSDREFVDWKSCVWAADAHFSGGTAIQSTAPVVHASPTLHDQQLYRTARSAKAFRYTVAAPPGLYTVHLKFAELWLAKPGDRPMDIEINGRLMRKSWDPASAAGRTGMAADLRIDNITPDKDGLIVIGLRATGANDAILQAIEIE